MSSAVVYWVFEAFRFVSESQITFKQTYIIMIYVFVDETVLLRDQKFERWA